MVAHCMQGAQMDWTINRIYWIQIIMHQTQLLIITIKACKLMHHTACNSFSLNLKNKTLLSSINKEGKLNKLQQDKFKTLSLFKVWPVQTPNQPTPSTTLLFLWTLRTPSSSQKWDLITHIPHSTKQTSFYLTRLCLCNHNFKNLTNSYRSVTNST